MSMSENMLALSLSTLTSSPSLFTLLASLGGKMAWISAQARAVQAKVMRFWICMMMGRLMIWHELGVPYHARNLLCAPPVRRWRGHFQVPERAFWLRPREDACASSSC